MTIFLVGATKGGVGKSTISVQTATGLTARGDNVFLIDGDRQGTSLDAVTVRTDSGRPAIAAAAYPDGKTLRAQLERQAKNYDHIIIDAGGRDSTALRAGLMLADVVVIPFMPRSFDVWAIANINALIEDEIAPVRGTVRTLAVLNAADPSGADNREAAEAISEYPSMRLAQAQLARRKAIAHASASGLFVGEYKPRDENAINEVNALIDELVAFAKEA